MSEVGGLAFAAAEPGAGGGKGGEDGAPYDPTDGDCHFVIFVIDEDFLEVRSNYESEKDVDQLA